MPSISESLRKASPITSTLFGQWDQQRKQREEQESRRQFAERLKRGMTELKTTSQRIELPTGEDAAEGALTGAAADGRVKVKGEPSLLFNHRRITQQKPVQRDLSFEDIVDLMPEAAADTGNMAMLEYALRDQDKRKKEADAKKLRRTVREAGGGLFETEEQEGQPTKVRTLVKQKETTPRVPGNRTTQQIGRDGFYYDVTMNPLTGKTTWEKSAVQAPVTRTDFRPQAEKDEKPPKRVVNVTMVKTDGTQSPVRYSGTDEQVLKQLNARRRAIRDMIDKGGASKKEGGVFGFGGSTITAAELWKKYEAGEVTVKDMPKELQASALEDADLESNIRTIVGDILESQGYEADDDNISRFLQNNL